MVTPPHLHKPEQEKRKTTGPPAIVLQQAGGRCCVAAGPRDVLTPRVSSSLLVAGGRRSNALDFIFYFDHRNAVLDRGETKGSCSFSR